MKKYSTTIISVMVLTGAITQSVKAQHPAEPESLRLDVIWKIAQNNNRELKLSDLNLQQSHMEVLEAKDRMLPELSLGADLKRNSRFLIYEGGLFSSPQQVPVEGYGYAAGYYADVNLFNGGRERRNITIKKEEEARRHYEADLHLQSIKYRVAVAYFDLYKSLHFHDFLSAEITTEKKQLHLVESLYKNGTVLKSDLLRTSVKISQLELELSNINKKTEIARQRLNMLMGRDQDKQLTINYQDTSGLDNLLQIPYGDYVVMALNSSPEFKLVNSDIKWSELNIRQAKTALLPKVSLYSTYHYTYPQISFYPYSNDLWGFGQTGIKTEFGVDNLYKSKHSIARAQVISNQAKEKADIKKDEILLQLKVAYLQQQQAVESMETIMKNIAKTTETVRVIRNSYLQQEALLSDLLEAENSLLEARFSLTTAQSEVQLTHIKLLTIAGII